MSAVDIFTWACAVVTVVAAAAAVRLAIKARRLRSEITVTLSADSSRFDAAVRRSAETARRIGI